MRCYFLRHGAAIEPADFAGPDFDRPLTGEGQDKMSREARTIAALSLDLDAIVTSPLVRAKQTAAIVAAELKMKQPLIEDERLGVDFNASHLASILGDHSDANAILLVGHEPSLSQTIGQIIGGARIDFKKGSLACVNVAGSSLREGELVWLIPPKVLTLESRR